MNWSRKYSPSLRLELQGSRGSLCLVTGVCLIALLSLSQVELPPLLLAFLATVILGWGLDALYRHWALAGPRAVRSLVRGPAGTWRLLDGGGIWCLATLTDAFCLGPGFNLLCWRDSRGLQRVAMVWADSATENQRRRLARNIRWRDRDG